MNSAPLLGPSLGPILGGVLTQGFNWRATFWFLAIFTGLCAISFIFFRDTFRRQRSMIYQTALKRLMEAEAKKATEKQQTLSEKETVVGQQNDEDRKSDRDVEAQTQTDAVPIKELKLSLKDVNPIGPIVHVLRRLNNLVVLLASGESQVLAA